MIRNWLTVRLFNATLHTVVLLVWRADRWNLVLKKRVPNKWLKSAETKLNGDSTENYNFDIVFEFFRDFLQFFSIFIPNTSVVIVRFILTIVAII